MLVFCCNAGMRRSPGATPGRSVYSDQNRWNASVGLDAGVLDHLAPAKTPPEIIDRLNKAAAGAVRADAFKKLSVNEGLMLVASPPAELDRYFRAEEDRWRKVIQDAGIKAD